MVWKVLQSWNPLLTRGEDTLIWQDRAKQVRQNFKLNEEAIHLLDAKHFIQEEKPLEIAEIITSVIR